MQMMTFLTAYNTELDTLEKELVTFRDKPREPHDFATHDGFAAQIRMLKNLGVGRKRVAELETKLAALAAEVFPEKPKPKMKHHYPGCELGDKCRCDAIDEHYEAEALESTF